VKYYFSGSQFTKLEELQAALPVNASIVAQIVSTVEKLNQSIIDSINNLLTDRLKTISIFDPAQQNFIKALYPGIGADRVAKLTGAAKLFPDKNIALIDFGTATTLSILGVDRNFAGGFISLGLQGSLKALSEQCAALDDYSDLSALDLSSLEPSIDSPAQAILKGSALGHLAMVSFWLTRAGINLQAKYPQSSTVSICTGGQAELFKRLFDQHVSDEKLLEACFNS